MNAKGIQGTPAQLAQAELVTGEDGSLFFLSPTEGKS